MLQFRQDLSVAALAAFVPVGLAPEASASTVELTDNAFTSMVDET